MDDVLFQDWARSGNGEEAVNEVIRVSIGEEVQWINAIIRRLMGYSEDSVESDR